MEKPIYNSYLEKRAKPHPSTGKEENQDEAPFSLKRNTTRKHTLK